MGVRSTEEGPVGSEEIDFLEPLAARYGLTPDVAETMGLLATMLSVDGRGTHDADKRRRIIMRRINLALAALELDVVTAARDVADFGTHYGIHGIVLALALPDSRVRFVDNEPTRCDRVSRMCEELGIGNVDVDRLHVMKWAEMYREGADLVVTHDMHLLRMATESAMMLREGGAAVLWEYEPVADTSVALSLVATKVAAVGRKSVQLFIYGRPASFGLDEVELGSRTPDLLELSPGSHRRREYGMCATEAVAWLAGEPHSDRPGCLSPVLASFLRALNDGLGPAERQKLAPHLPGCIGTADDGQDDLRRALATNWLIRVATPIWLDAAGLGDDAASLRALPEAGVEDPAATTAALSSARTRAIAARTRSREHLVAVAEDPQVFLTAAGVAAPAYSAAFTVTAAAAVASTSADVADTVAYIASDSATYGAEYPAYLRRQSSVEAIAAAEGVLQPTKQQILSSMLGLFERMIDPARFPGP